MSFCKINSKDVMLTEKIDINKINRWKAEKQFWVSIKCNDNVMIHGKNFWRATDSPVVSLSDIIYSAQGAPF